MEPGSRTAAVSLALFVGLLLGLVLASFAQGVQRSGGGVCVDSPLTARRHDSVRAPHHAARTVGVGESAPPLKPSGALQPWYRQDLAALADTFHSHPKTGVNASLEELKQLAAVMLEVIRRRSWDDFATPALGDGLWAQHSAQVASRLAAGRAQLASAWQQPCQHNRTVRMFICAVVKHEARYLQEWVTWHLLLGFERIFIMADGLEDDTTEAILEPFVRADLVSLARFPNTGGQQGKAYELCFDRIREDTLAGGAGAPDAWAAVYDADEFLIVEPDASLDNPRPPGLPSGCLQDMLHAQRAHGAVTANWVWFGVGDSLMMSHGQLVTEAQTWRHPSTNRHIKSIMRVANVVRPILHDAVYKEGTYAVNAVGMRVDGPYDVSSSAVPPHSLKLRLHHYWSKSVEELLHKFSRGRADISGKYHIRVIGELLDELGNSTLSVRDDSALPMAAAVRMVLTGIDSRPGA